MPISKTLERRLRKLDGNTAEWLEFVSETKGKLDDKFESRSDKWKESEKGEEMGNDINRLDELHTALENLQEAINSFDLEY